MKKKFRNSLTAKIFLLALLLFLLCSTVTYALFLLITPRTYSRYLDSNLNDKIQNFIFTLETTSFNDSGTLFDNFLKNPDISSIELTNSFGEHIVLPTQKEIYKADTSTFVQSEYNTTPLTMQNYNFLFLDSDTYYTLSIYGNSQSVNQLQEVFIQITPLLFLFIVLISVFIAWIFSIIVTKPLLKTIRIAENMSRLSLDWHCDETRMDELGILQKSLNIMSQNLSSALRDLQTANCTLLKDIEKEKEIKKARLEFFSIVSHELKTPITIIKGQLQGMLLDVGVYKNHKKYLARSLDITDTLENMVQEILTVSRLEIETSNTYLFYGEFDIAQIINAYLASTEYLIIRKNLLLYTDIEEPTMVKGDKSSLTKVIGNLISNAIFYSPPENKIFITAKRVDNYFYFSIENTGIHIANEIIPKIFEAFYRIEQSRSRQTGGSGLGLYIVQKILEQHNTCCIAQNTERGIQFLFKL